MLNTPFAAPEVSKESLEQRIFYLADSVGTEKEDGKTYVDICNRKVIEIGGITHPSENQNEFYRLDASKRETYSQANRGLAECLSGVTVRFITDADEVTLDVSLRSSLVGMHHFTDRGVYGFDVYKGTGTDRVFATAQMQMLIGTPEAMKDTVKNLGTGLKEIEICFPLYGGIKKMEIGFPKGTRVALPTKRDRKAIAFYGSSITQGGCASRPGTAYHNIICRALNADCRNLGFSGSAFGEQYVAEYIAGLDLSAFVMDYDYNSITLEELQTRHYPFYETVRKAQPELPIVILPHVWSTPDREEDFKRVQIVKSTYEQALKNGDTHVAFVDSTDFFRGPMRDLCTVDALHPNDNGMLIMACEVYKALVGLK